MTDVPVWAFMYMMVASTYGVASFIRTFILQSQIDDLKRRGDASEERK